jgi:ComF family protein
MAARMAALNLPHEASAEIRFVVAVPLTPVRLRERGYNQAALLARCVATSKEWRVLESALERAHSHSSQTALHPAERRANVAGAFRVRAGVEDRLLGEHLLLVDDVWTTGATALACCDALLTAGARAVTVLTFARALPDLQRDARRLDLAGATSNPD